MPTRLTKAAAKRRISEIVAKSRLLYLNETLTTADMAAISKICNRAMTKLK